MTAISLPRRNFPVWLTLLLIVALVGLAYLGIPRAPHADVSHSNQQWNAPIIQAYFDLGKCKPHIDICEEEDFEVHWCEIDNKNSVGLIIGHTVKKVVTGYMARTKYWSTKCQ